MQVLFVRGALWSPNIAGKIKKRCFFLGGPGGLGG
jgi:hypothetical protein